MMSVDDQVTSSQADVFPNVLTIAPSSILAVSPTGDDLNEEDENIAVSPGALLSSQGYLVSPSLNNPTLQGLLTSPSGLQGAQLGLPEGIQIINLSSPSSILPAQSDGRIWHVISPDDTIIAVGNEDFKQALANGEVIEDGDQISATATMSVDNLEVQADLSSVLMPPPQQPLPPGCPAWAARLKNCEKIGDYYRGYVDTDVELDILLTYHKQATQSFWGTRQSPSPAKQSTRFMWKSQYVPYDGVPFVNTGSRAVVMECQYGPRRKASWTKKQMDSSKEYKQTCPARIYIKKVRKFPEFKIDTGLDKKIMKSAMDKAFHCLKTQNVEKIGQDRYYVQLPLPSAHEFHYDMPTRGANGTIIPQIQVSTHTQTQESQTGEINSEDTETSSDKKQHRLHPLVAQKIREIVASGETRVYHVRRNLRMFVCQELYNGQMDGNLSRHDLSLFPTVTDLKNHIHQAVKDIESGVLALTAPQVSVEQLTASGDNMVQLSELGLLQHSPAVVSSGQGPVPETVTVTLTQSPGDDNGHVISRIETHMSDGTTQISSSLTPETAQLLARLNPAMFPPGSLVQLKADPESQLTVQAVTSDMSNTTDLDHASFVSMGNSSSIDTHSYAEMDLENPSPEESLNIQSAVDSALAMPSLVTGQVSAAIMSTGNPSLNEQSAQLINVSIVPTEADLEDMQAECCEDDL